MVNNVRMAPSQKDNWFSLVVLGASFLTQMIIFGLVLCFGIYFVTLLDFFNCTKKDVAIIGSVAYGTKCLTGLLSSILYRRFGCRLVVMSGGLVASAGCFLSCFATEVHHLYATYGLIMGFGVGLAYLPTLGILPDYFEKYRYFAVAFATVGSAAGTFIFQPIFHRLILGYGWQGSMVINAGFALQIVVLGALMKSRTVNPNLKLSSLFEKSLFRETKFYLLLLNSVLWGGTCYVVFSMVNSLVIAHGLDKEQSTIVASAMGLSNGFGRLFSSVIGHFSTTNRPLLYAVATLLFSSAAIAATQCWSMSWLLAALCLFGFTFGAMLSQMAGVAIDLFGVERLVNGLGYGLFAVGLGGMTLPPLAAGLADVFAVETAFHLAGAFGIAAAAAAFLFTCLKFRDDRLAVAARGKEFALEQAEHQID